MLSGCYILSRTCALSCYSWICLLPSFVEHHPSTGPPSHSPRVTCPHPPCPSSSLTPPFPLSLQSPRAHGPPAVHPHVHTCIQMFAQRKVICACRKMYMEACPQEYTLKTSCMVCLTVSTKSVPYKSFVREEPTFSRSSAGKPLSHRVLLTECRRMLEHLSTDCRRMLEHVNSVHNSCAKRDCIIGRFCRQGPS